MLHLGHLGLSRILGCSCNVVWLGCSGEVSGSILGGLGLVSGSILGGLGLVSGSFLLSMKLDIDRRI